jgi:uncharacterized protein with von Willebrand factor type A (vWA) domain
MVESNEHTGKFKVKYFDLDGGNTNFVQLEATMTEKEHEMLLTGSSSTGSGAKVQLGKPGEGKMLIMCLDTSGSMSGRPIRALQAASKHLGTIIKEASDKGAAPFEEFYTLAYESRIREYRYKGDHGEYESFIDGLYGGGGTYFG